MLQWGRDLSIAERVALRNYSIIKDLAAHLRAAIIHA